MNLLRERQGEDEETLITLCGKLYILQANSQTESPDGFGKPRRIESDEEQSLGS